MIRYATLNDAAGIWQLLMDLHARQSYFRLTPEKLEKTLSGAINGGRCLVAVKGGRIVGTFAWAVTSTYFSDDRFVADLWMYVSPMAGYPTAALRMKREMKRAAASLGLPLMLGVVGPEQRGNRLFEKDPDFEKAGVLYFMRQ